MRDLIAQWRVNTVHHRRIRILEEQSLLFYSWRHSRQFFKRWISLSKERNLMRFVIQDASLRYTRRLMKHSFSIWRSTLAHSQDLSRKCDAADQYRNEYLLDHALCNWLQRFDTCQRNAVMAGTIAMISTFLSKIICSKL
jgi:hypothetical protein